MVRIKTRDNKFIILGLSFQTEIQNNGLNNMYKFTETIFDSISQIILIDVSGDSTPSSSRSPSTCSLNFIPVAYKNMIVQDKLSPSSLQT